MSIPEFKANAGIYLLTWADQKLTIRLDRIREDSRHNITGEILVKCSLPGMADHIHTERLNLTSGPAKTRLAKYLATRMNGVEWGEYIEQASVMTVRHFREGEPSVVIGDLPARETLKYRVEPLLLEGEPNVIYGPGGVGKSYLALYMAVLLEGFMDCGFDVEPGRVLYLDYETGQYEIRDRITAIQKGLGIEDKSTLIYRYCSQSVAADIEETQRLVVEKNISLLVVDSVGAACGGEPENAEVVLNYFRALRSTKVTTLSIDHIAKGEGKTTTPFGSVYKYNQARNIWEVKKQQHADDDEINIGLFHRKVNSGKLLRPIGLKITFDGDKVIFARSDLKDVAELAEFLPLRERLKTALQHGGKTVEELSEELSVHSNQVQARLNERRNRDFTIISVRGKENVWGLYLKTESTGV